MKLRTAMPSLRENVVSMKLLVLMTVSDDCGLPSDSIRQSDPDHGRLGPRSMTRSKILRPCCFGHTPGRRPPFSIHGVGVANEGLRQDYRAHSLVLSDPARRMASNISASALF